MSTSKDSLFRILVFEDDPDHKNYLKTLLKSSDMQLSFEENLHQAVQRFKSSPFDLTIINIEMSDEEGEELAWSLIENYPRRSIILTGMDKTISPEQEELLTHKSVLGYFQAPMDPNILTRLLYKPDRGLRGQVQRMQVNDLLQALRYSQKVIYLQFFDAILQQDAWVYMKNSDIIHVEVYQRNTLTQEKLLLASGMDGFDKLQKFKNGIFTEQVWQEPSEYSIQLPFDGLMMSAAQKMDENLWQVDAAVKIRKALLIDHEAMSRMMLQQALLAEGIDCQSLRSVDLLWDALEDQQSQLLILDASLDESEVYEILTWIKEAFPICRILLLGTPNWDKTMPVPVNILPRPVSPKRLKEILFEITQVGFRGFLSRIGVLEFLQLNLAAMEEQKKLHIRDLDNGVDGQIYIDHGRFVHAQFEDLVGEEAFYRIAAIEKGDFFEDPSFHPPARSLEDIMPHKLMIRAGRFVKPLEEPELIEYDVPAPVQKPLVPIAPVTPSASPEPVAEGGMTNLFGDDEVGEIQLNLDKVVPVPVAEGGMTNLFGDDEVGEIQLNLDKVESEIAVSKPTVVKPVSTPVSPAVLRKPTVLPDEKPPVLQSESQPIGGMAASSPQAVSDKFKELRKRLAERRSSTSAGQALSGRSSTLLDPHEENQKVTSQLSSAEKLQELRKKLAEKKASLSSILSTDKHSGSD